MTLTSQQAALLLCRIPNLGPRRIKKLIDHCDGAKNVLKATLDKLLQINGVGPSHIKYLEGWKAHLPQLKKEEKVVQQHLLLRPYTLCYKTLYQQLQHWAKNKIQLQQHQHQRQNLQQPMLQVNLPIGKPALDMVEQII